MVFRSLHQLLNIENHLDDTMEVDEEPKGELNEMGQDHHGSEVFSQADEEGELPDWASEDTLKDLGDGQGSEKEEDSEEEEDRQGELDQFGFAKL